jgi:hypothetical protein
MLTKECPHQVRCVDAVGRTPDQPFRRLRLERSDQLGEVAIERLLISALDEDLVAITEDERAEHAEDVMEAHPDCRAVRTVGAVA